MEPAEVRQLVQRQIIELLNELAVDDDMSDDERETVGETMAGLGEMLLDYLHFTVVSVEGDTVHATVVLRDPALP